VGLDTSRCRQVFQFALHAQQARIAPLRDYLPSQDLAQQELIQSHLLQYVLIVLLELMLHHLQHQAAQAVSRGLILHHLQQQAAQTVSRAPSKYRLVQLPVLRVPLVHIAPPQDYLP